MKKIKKIVGYILDIGYVFMEGYCIPAFYFVLTMGVVYFMVVITGKSVTTNSLWDNIKGVLLVILTLMAYLGGITVLVKEIKRIR